MITRKTFLRNEEGGSPGGGSPTPPPATPTATPAAAPPAAPSLDDIKNVVASQFTEMRNGIFADLRKAGALKQEKIPTSEQPKADPASQAPDVKRIIQRENAIGRGEAKFAMTTKQVEYMRNALEQANPDDERAWIDSYASDMGLASPTPPPATTAPITPPFDHGIKPPAAAPAAPTKVDPLTSSGLTDVFRLDEAQLHQLGPSGLRAEFEKILKQAQQQTGAPSRPKPGPRT